MGISEVGGRELELFDMASWWRRVACGVGKMVWEMDDGSKCLVGGVEVPMGET